MTIPTAMFLLPLFAAAAILLGTRRSGNISALISVGSSAICFVFALVFLGVENLPTPSLSSSGRTWAGSVSISISRSMR